MRDLIDDYLIHKESSEGRSASTVDKYRGYLHMLQAWIDGPIEKATAEQLLTFTGAYAHKELQLTPTARRPLVAAVRGFFGWLEEREIVKRSPAASIPYPKSGRKLPTAMQLGSAEKLLMQPDLGTFIGVRDAAILSILIGCGPRISGVAGLNESHLIWTQTQGEIELAIIFEEKGQRQRMVPAHPDTMWMVRAYLGHPELEGIDRSLPDGDRVLFVSVGNKRVPAHEYHGEARRISARSIDNKIKQYGEKAGIPASELHAHALRHLFGTELAESDIDVLVRQALLGHADPKTTEIYTHLAMRKIIKASRHASPLSKIRSPVTGLSKIMKQDS